MKTLSVKFLVDFLRSQIGVSGADDMIYEWIEEAVTIIREQPWNWNWKKEKSLTLDPVVIMNGKIPHLFTWNIGDNYITSTVLILPVNYMYTGRRIKLGDEWYTVSDIALSNPARIYVDNQIDSSNIIPTQITLYRTNYSISTSIIKSVRCGRLNKLVRYSKEYFERHFMNESSNYENREPSTPVGYTELDESEIPAPKYPPTYTPGSGTSFINGKYRYFFTRYDSENHLESKPGPYIDINVVDTKYPVIKYGNPISDSSDTTTFHFRLYRSDRDFTRERPPMFLIEERTPFILAPPFEDTNITANLRTQRYFEGPRTLVELYPPPSATRLPLVFKYLDNWAYIPNDDENIEMGIDGQVIELLRLHLCAVSKLTSRNAGEYKAAIAQFRTHMHYLLGRSRSSGDGDITMGKCYPDIPGTMPNNTAWVDNLPWGSDW